MTDRPRPLQVAATEQSTVPSIAGGSATTVLLAAIATRGQADLIALILAAGIVAINVATPILAARRTATAGERQVTPLDAPQDDDGTPLIRPEGQLLGEALTGILDQLLAMQRAPAPPAPVHAWTPPPPPVLPAAPRPAPAYDPASTQLPPPPYEEPGRHAVRDRW